MNWKTLIITIAVVYPIYYAIIILLDKLKSNKNKDNSGYESVAVDFEEEETEKVYDENYFEESTNENEEDTNEDNSIELGQVVSQGLPVDEFLKNAKNLVLGIEY